MNLDHAYDLTDELTRLGFIVPGREEDVENFLKDYWPSSDGDDDEENYSASADWKTSLKRVMNMEPAKRQVVLDYVEWELNDILAEVESHYDWGRDEIIEYVKGIKANYATKAYKASFMDAFQNYSIGNSQQARPYQQIIPHPFAHRAMKNVLARTYINVKTANGYAEVITQRGAGLGIMTP